MLCSICSRSRKAATKCASQACKACCLEKATKSLSYICSLQTHARDFPSSLPPSRTAPPASSSALQAAPPLLHPVTPAPSLQLTIPHSLPPFSTQATSSLFTQGLAFGPTSLPQVSLPTLSSLSITSPPLSSLPTIHSFPLSPTLSTLHAAPSCFPSQPLATASQSLSCSPEIGTGLNHGLALDSPTFAHTAFHGNWNGVAADNFGATGSDFAAITASDFVASLFDGCPISSDTAHVDSDPLLMVPSNTSLQDILQELAVTQPPSSVLSVMGNESNQGPATRATSKGKTPASRKRTVTVTRGGDSGPSFPAQPPPSKSYAKTIDADYQAMVKNGAIKVDKVRAKQQQKHNFSLIASKTLRITFWLLVCWPCCYLVLWLHSLTDGILLDSRGCCP